MAGLRRSLRSRAARAVPAAIAAILLSAFVTTATPQVAQARSITPVKPASTIAQHPYLGWSSWSLESTNYPGVNPTGSASYLTEKNVLTQADVLAAKLKSHGYEYVNVDAGWLGGFDAYGRPVPNATTFPDGIRYLADHVHRKGLRLGIYLAVGLDPKAYGTGGTPIFGAPDCHTSDLVYPDKRLTNGWNSSYLINYASPCAQAYANSIADELAGWQVDFLKMDGVGPGSSQGDANHDNTPDIKAWSAALQRTGRPIQYVLSWSLSHNDAATWQSYSNGWRVDTDVECYCDTLVTWNNSVKERWNDVVQWIPNAGPGHWNNLDSLDVGVGAMDGITDIERQSYMTLWSIEAAPLYEGDDLTKLDSYGLSLLTNDEVIAVDQAGNPAKPVDQNSDQQVWVARNPDGSDTVALFNLGGSAATVTANWSDLGLTGTASVHDLWSHANLGAANGSFSATLPSHGARLLRITPADTAGPAIPLFPHGTAATPTSVALTWDAATERGSGIAGYDVYAGATKVASVTGTSATVSHLNPATGYRFTVVARDTRGGRSAPSQAVDVTTEAATGAVAYEAEASGNTVAGGASVTSCAECSGGAKIGNLGGSGYVAIKGVRAPAAGTYLMRVTYVDGDSSRTAVVTVNGTPFNLPLSGTNDNNWGKPQTVTVPVVLSEGNNTVQFGNPTDYASDIDKITV
jgi:chitodextrinase